MALVMLALPFLVGYSIGYRLLLYPRYLEVCRRIDTRSSYQPAVKKSRGKKARADAPQKPVVPLLPGKALIGLFGVPIVYYFIMAFVSIPPYLPPQSHNHLLHEVGMLVMGFFAAMGCLLSLQ